MLGVLLLFSASYFVVFSCMFVWLAIVGGFVCSGLVTVSVRACVFCVVVILCAFAGFASCGLVFVLCLFCLC